MGKYSDLLQQDIGATGAPPQGRYSGMLAADLKAPAPKAAPAPAKPVKKAPDNVSNLLNALPGSLGQDLEQAGVGDALRGYQHALVDPVHGIAQFAENALAKGASLLPDNPVSRYLQQNAQQTNNAMAARQRDYQQSITHPGAATAGEVAGNIAPFLSPNAVSSLLKTSGGAVGNLAARVPAVGRFIAPVADAASQGALVAATNPVTTPDYWSDKGRQVGIGAGLGGVVGGTVGALTGAANRVAPQVRALIDPQGTAAETLANLSAAGDAQRAEQLGQALRGGNVVGGKAELVPGSQPTLAELVGTPDIIRLQKTLGNRPEVGAQFAARQAQNNAARWQAIQDVAGTDEGLQAAIEARRANAAPRIDALLTNGQPVNADPVLDALQGAQRSPFGVDPVINRGLTDVNRTIRARALPQADTGPAILDANGAPLNPVTPSPTQIMPDQLDAVRQNLRNFISDNASNGAVRSKQEAGLTPIQNAITDAIESANPGYRAHLAAYAQDSVPINTMEAGRAIADDLGHRSLGAVGAEPLNALPQLTLSGYHGAMTRALNNAPYGIAPEAENALNAVQNDLQRATLINAQANAYGGGSATSPNIVANDWLLNQLNGQEPGTAKLLGQQLLKFIPGAGHGMQAWTDAATRRSAQALADMLLNPTTAGADALQQWSANQNQSLLPFLQSLPLIPGATNP